MLPTTKVGTLKVIPYAAEVGGRLLGVAASPNLLPNAEVRRALEASGNRIIAATRATASALVPSLLFEYLDRRISVGRGKGLDRGWDRAVSTASDRAREVVPDRSTSSVEYREIFTDGTTAEYTNPTIKQDPEVAAKLRQFVENLGLSVRDEMLAILDAVMPLLAPAAAEVREGEERTRTLSAGEVAARTKLVDLLWSERKAAEALLGRSGRSMIRFLFPDFGKSRSPSTGTTPPGDTPVEPGPPDDLDLPA